MGLREREKTEGVGGIYSWGPLPAFQKSSGRLPTLAYVHSKVQITLLISLVTQSLN